jgi:hypothetical protein
MQYKQMKAEVREEKQAAKAIVKRKDLAGRFVTHITIPDGTQLPCGQPFVKTWRFRNEGKLTWPSDTLLVFVSKQNGDLMEAPSSVAIGKCVKPEEEVDVSVPFVAPSQTGMYNGFWKLCLSSGKKFGQRVWVKIQTINPSDNQPMNLN